MRSLVSIDDIVIVARISKKSSCNSGIHPDKPIVSMETPSVYKEVENRGEKREKALEILVCRGN